MLRWILNYKFIRRKIIFHLKNYFFHEFHHSIPLGNNYWAHLCETDSYDSFSEIFVKQEYANFIPRETILKVLDLGANYGYFSLWLQSIRSKDKITSTLIEPSKRCKRSLEKLILDENIHPYFKYIQGVVCNPNKKITKFYDRPFMAGSLFGSSDDDLFYNANTLRPSDILSSDTESYDLIKCDIEGGEWEFILNYSCILRKSKFLVMEWHSWHSGNGGFEQINNRLTELGFQIIKSSPPQKAIGRDGEVGLFLAQNHNFLN